MQAVVESKLETLTQAVGLRRTSLWPYFRYSPLWRSQRIGQVYRAHFMESGLPRLLQQRIVGEHLLISVPLRPH